MAYAVDARKITDYLLNDTHLTGRSKSAFFRGHGFKPEEWEVFRDALLQHPVNAALSDTDGSSKFGVKTIHECRLLAPDGSNPCIRSVWQQRAGVWHLLTAYPFI